ncbi:uncharacterized protein si:ch1073-220m6.1 [Electrophorus electricus]|nr:uncharacterized protein si:ch1073-220m6.1 [Electrophorus electricus]
MRSPLCIFTFIIMSFIADCAEQSPMVLYEMKGKTVHLSLGEQLNMTQLKWRKKEELIATLENQKTEIKVRNKYGLEVSNGSLTIKNVTEEDSGLYKAQHGQWETNVIQYHLKVQEAVSDPIINTGLLQLNSSADVCRVLINCSADGDTVMYDCDLQNCPGTNFSLSGVNITIAVTSNGIVECEAINHVSKKKTSTPMDITCAKMNTAIPDRTPDFILVWIPVLACLMMVCLLGVFFLIKGYYSKKKSQVENIHSDREINTVYTVVHKRRTPTENPAANCPPLTVYDVPSKYVKAFQSTNEQMQTDNREHSLEEQTSTANTEVQEKAEDKHLTVYWTLGQKL